MTLRNLLLAAVLAMAAAAPATAKPLLVGFYLPWDAASQGSLRRHARSLDVAAPMLASVVSPAGEIRWQDDPAGREVAAKRPRVMPVISNAHDEVWDTLASDGVILTAAARDGFAAQLVTRAKAQGFSGYVIDFENLSPRGEAGLAAFLAAVRAQLRPQGLELWVTAGLSADDALVQRLAAATDAVVLMAYDQCWATSTPGPIAGNAWLAAELEARLRRVDPRRYVVALGAYGYDWPAGQTATVVSAPGAAALAKAQGRRSTRQAPDGNPHFAYVAGGRAHAVWYLDAGTFRAQQADTAARGVRGVALWRLGLEDPAIWTPAATVPSSGRPAGTAATCAPLPARR